MMVMSKAKLVGELVNPSGLGLSALLRPYEDFQPEIRNGHVNPLPDHYKLYGLSQGGCPVLPEENHGYFPYHGMSLRGGFATKQSPALPSGWIASSEPEQRHFSAEKVLSGSSSK